MVSMDLNCKGITWVGSIYQKFGAMCQEVEDIVCQDTLKYVESQVQTVGENVMKFYAEVVEDLLPPVSMDPSKQADSDLSLEKNADVGIGKQSKVVIEKDDLKEKSPVPKEPKSIASVRKDSNCVARNASQLLSPSSVKPIKEDLSLEQDRFSVHKLAKAGNGEDRREKKSGTKASSLGRRVHKEPKLFASVQKNSSRVTHNPSSVKLVKREGFDSSPELGNISVCKISKTGSGEDSKKEKQADAKASSFGSTGHLISPSSVDPTKEAGADLYGDKSIRSGMHLSSGLRIGKDTLNEKSPLVDASKVIAPAWEYSGGRFLLCIRNQNGDELTKSAPSTPVEVGFNTLPKAGSIHSSVLSETVDIPKTLPSSDLVFPVVLPENKTVELGQSLSANSLSTESNASVTSTSNDAVSLMGSLKDGLEQGKICGTELRNFTSPSEIAITGRSEDDHEALDWGNDDVEQGIEIIENDEDDENVKLGESCIVVDSKEFHFISHKEGKNRSYKKKFRDAFASRKGLAKKDYEQLATWCEDLDARTNQEITETSALSTLPTTTHDSCEESEWELL